MFVHFLLLYLLPLFATPSPQYGRDTYGKEELTSLEVQGTVKLNGTTVKETLKVTGALITRNAELTDVEGVGDLQFYDTSVAHHLHATGSLRAFRSVFKSPILFSGQRALFSACQLEKLSLEREFGFKGAQVVELKDKTIIEGEIEFLGGAGKVHLYPGSRIGGPIIGGEIVYKN